MHHRIDFRIKLALIYSGSLQGQSKNVAGWTTSQIEGDGPFDVTVIGLDMIDQFESVDDKQQPDCEELGEIIDWADGFVIVTPEHDRGHLPILKFLIDRAGPEWRGKPAGFVSYGGVSSGGRAVEQLRSQLWDLHAVPIRDGVALGRDPFDRGGQLLDVDCMEQAMATMLAQLHWWASALRTARRRVPYGQFAPVFGYSDYGVERATN
ncbi:hypothetical protein ES707_12847 [subsurface metagenome]